MTVPASRRGKNRMEVFTKANELCAYTVEITANERTFKPEFAMLTARIVDASVAIGLDLWSASNIKDRAARPPPAPPTRCSASGSPWSDAAGE